MRFQASFKKELSMSSSQDTHCFAVTITLHSALWEAAHLHRSFVKQPKTDVHHGPPLTCVIKEASDTTLNKGFLLFGEGREPQNATEYGTKDKRDY